MTNLTLKNLPDPLYLQLKESARLHHRSINGEVIYCLEQALLPQQANTEEQLLTARQIREKTAHYKVSNTEIDNAKAEGRL